MKVSDAKRLRGLEEENARLKKLLAESMLDVSTLREMLAKTSDASAANAARFGELAAIRRDLGDEGKGHLAAAGPGKALALPKQAFVACATNACLGVCENTSFFLLRVYTLRRMMLRARGHRAEDLPRRVPAAG